MQEIILLEDVEGFGRRGSIVRAKNGFALNYLLPQKKGVLANKDNLKRLEKLRVKFEAEEKERIVRAKSLSERFEGKSITITMKASEEGGLYGSVSVPTIVEALAADGLEVDARVVKLAEPIKHVGVYDVPIHLHETVKLDLKVWVVAEKAATAEVEADATAEGGEPAAAETAAAATEGATAGEGETDNAG
ncbi:MAG: 50S ribosomal protein L9 [Planctomycetota bacterium JB042]